MAQTPGQSLKILHVNSLLNGGGTDDICVKLAAALRRDGLDVSLAGPEGREYSRIAHDLGLPLHPIVTGGPAHVRFVLQIVRLLKRERPDVLHSHHGRDYWPALLAVRLSRHKPKLVLTRHLAKSPGSWASREYLLDRCDAMIAVSNFVARVLTDGVFELDSPEPERRARPPMRGNPDRVHVLYSGFDTDRFQPADAAAMRREWGLAPGEFAFGVVGGYPSPRGKGQREFLQAAARISERVPHARFLIVGRGDLKETLERDISRLGLGHVARLTPYCNDVPAAMNALDCLVHPQVGTEALGGVVIEAQACGRPVIATAVDGIPEAFGAGSLGQLVRPDSVVELADAMLAWSQRPPLSLEERQAIHERVASRFSLAAATRRYARFYQWITTSRQRRRRAPDWNHLDDDKPRQDAPSAPSANGTHPS